MHPWSRQASERTDSVRSLERAFYGGVSMQYQIRRYHIAAG